jgi:SH3-like domain-containing protein
VQQGSITKVGVAAALAALLLACRITPQTGPALGEAFVGPSTLNLRSDIPTQSPTVTIVRHGDRLVILQRRRSFLKVRAPNGTEGWTEERQLLAASDMTALKALAARAERMPSQGRALTDADLRVHTQPSGRSPSFLTLQANTKVDVLTHLLRPRTDLPRAPLVPPAPAKQTAPAKKKSKSRKEAIPLPPAPKPPPPPDNWLELSKPDLPEDELPQNATAPQAEVPSDDWSLVRTEDGQSGWVLTRRFRMAIPDDVGQWAEGHRIVSYFSLGTIMDGAEKKDIWLWTTIQGRQPYDFDSFRVFVWNLRRHRYETQYIERNLKGYSPVLLEKVDAPAGKGKAAEGVLTGFSLCVEKKDGIRYRRSYALVNTSIRFIADRACEAPQPMDFDASSTPAVAPSPAATPPPEGFFERFKKRLKALSHGHL